MVYFLIRIYPRLDAFSTDDAPSSNSPLYTQSGMISAIVARTMGTRTTMRLCFNWPYVNVCVCVSTKWNQNSIRVEHFCRVLLIRKTAVKALFGREMFGHGDHVTLGHNRVPPVVSHIVAVAAAAADIVETFKCFN